MSTAPSAPNAAKEGARRARAQSLLSERMNLHYRETDRLFAYLMGAQWAFAIVIALRLSPRSWSGWTATIHPHVYAAFLLGGALSSLPIYLAVRHPGAIVTRHVVAVSQMLWSGLLIHLTGGRLETHFHVFGSLAFLAFYRDYRVLIPATLVVAGDHLLRQLLWPESVYGVSNPEWWRSLEHAGWVVFEDLFLVISCVRAVREMRDHADQQVRIDEANRIEREMEIAARIQTSILPRNPTVPGLEISAGMVTASEVGGDYYDVLPVDGGAWFGIGDVAGHGLPAGLVMLQAQSALEALCRRDPNLQPRDLVLGVNEVLVENVRNRLVQEEHMTMSVLRYFADGRVVSAGAHEEAIVCRAETGACETVEVEGAWLGITRDIGAATVETTIHLGEQDLLILYTDGVTETRSPSGEQFGIERLKASVQRMRHQHVDAVRDAVLAEVAHFRGGAEAEDDVTLLVIRRNTAAAACVVPGATAHRAAPEAVLTSVTPALAGG